MITRCLKCKKRIEVQDSFANQRVKCAYCGEVFNMPLSPVQESSAGAAISVIGIMIIGGGLLGVITGGVSDIVITIAVIGGIMLVGMSVIIRNMK